MKNFLTKYTAIILIVVMFILLIPGISLRLENESKNKSVVISLLYNDIRNKLNQSELSFAMQEYKNNGINMVSIMEDDVNSLVARGDLTCIKYNVLNHKYDQQSIDIANFISQNCPDVSYDSYILLVTKEETKEKLSYMLPRKYTEKDYSFAGTMDGIDLYVLYNGRIQLWNYALGFDEKVIDELYNQGFDISLIYKVKNYQKLDYLDDIDRIVKKYNVEYFNIKEGADELETAKKVEENYKGIADIINKNNLTMVVTENTDQLSNQKCFGYDYIFNEVMNGSKKVLRSYETYDDSQSDDSNYKYRTTQYFNSTVDRNIRFITVTQIAVEDVTFNECADLTLRATTEYKDMIEKEGYTISGSVTPTDYFANKELNGAASVVIAIMCLLIMLEIITGKKDLRITLGAVILSVLGFAASFVMPSSLLSLYPTAFCMIQSCFAMTVVMWFIKTYKDKMHSILLAICSVLTALAILLLGAVAMGCMLSGIDYHVNNDIFRGIKLSLIVPVFYTAVLYYFMFIKTEKSSILQDIQKAVMADIKVYWVLIGAVILGVGLYYIIRSGNVNKISGLEQAMRTTLTEIFPARPRTKEFLVGYPALVLFAYYMKNSKIHIINWILAVAASILAASVTNSFCHVFTDFTFIVSRTINGMIIGILVSVAAYIINLALVRIVTAIGKRLNSSEMK